MKLIKYADFTLQTLIIAIPIVGYFLLKGDQYITTILFAQLWLGVLQLLSCSISVLIHGDYYDQKKNHLAGAMIYLLIFFGAMSGGALMQSQLFIMLPPWILALYYYFLTWLTAFRNHEKGGKFLPHTSF